MPEISKLLAGFRVFRATYFDQRPRLFTNLARKGQHPKVLIVACSDSRVDPAILFNSEPGELFVVRNVANLVPPYQPDEHYHGTSAALEFGVRDLGVRDIVVLGHSSCGGIDALCAAAKGRHLDREFIAPWISIAESACAAAPAGEGEDGADNRAVEQAAIARSLDNLRTFPWVAGREEEGTLGLHGWWFEMERGTLWALDRKSREFAVLEPTE